MEELYILRDVEFQLLAAALDFTRIYGIYPKGNPNEVEAMYSLHEMAQKGILKQEGERLRLTEPYCTAIQNMKQARRVLSVSEVVAPLSNVCFYLGDMAVSLEESPQDENSVRIGTFKLKSLCSQLSDRELLPDPLWDKDVIERHLREDNTLHEWQKYARFQVFVLDGEEVSESSFYLWKGSGSYWVSEKEDIGTKCRPYDKEQFFRQLWEALEQSDEEKETGI